MLSKIIPIKSIVFFGVTISNLCSSPIRSTANTIELIVILKLSEAPRYLILCKCKYVEVGTRGDKLPPSLSSSACRRNPP